MSAPGLKMVPLPIATGAPQGNTDDEKLTPDQLVERWINRIGKKTLANWRSEKKGPKFMRIGNRILYPLAHVLAWEKQNTFESTSDYGKTKD